MKSTIQLVCSIAMMIALFFSGNMVQAQQQYKLSQVSNIAGMKSETTIYVKGQRKRTESNGYMGMKNNTIIEQCDKQRTIHINDKKKLYFIEPFNKEQEVLIEDDTKTSSVKLLTAGPKDGGTITNYFNIRDTGERKKIFGFTARRIWTTQRMIPSANACMMKDSMVIKTDGWYIDFPDFNCSINNRITSAYNGGYQKPSCQDKFITRRTGKGKLGFALSEKRTTIMGGQTQASEFVTDLETIELNTDKLDSMLFEIPIGYREAKSIDELQEFFADIDNNDAGTDAITLPGINSNMPKKEGSIRIGVLLPTGDEALQYDLLSNAIAFQLTHGNVEAVTLAGNEDDAMANCDYVLSTTFSRFKKTSKIGGLLKVIKETDPASIQSYTVSVSMVLKKNSTGATQSNLTTNGKYEGNQQSAAVKALEKSCRDLLKEL
ncbi:MAG TPA: hypothetical protein PK504_01475 [Ferruginibacter sp.]|nr:hypothetical protein [Ferruginibacter sp.]